MMVPNVPFERVVDPGLSQALTVARYHWGFMWTGTREQLIAAQLVQEGQFPGDPDRARTSVRFPKAGPGGLWWIDREKRGRFNARFNATPVDTLVYDALRAAKERRRDAFEASIRRVQEGGVQ